MKKLVKAISIVSITIAAQGCGLHYHPPHPISIGISSAPKGASGEVSSPGRIGAAKAQRKQQIEEQLSTQAQQSGYKGPTGETAGTGVAGEPRHTQPEQEQLVIGPTFVAGAFLKLLELCIIHKCRN